MSGRRTRRRGSSVSNHRSSADVRAQLDHPVIDSDGHVIEFLPAAWPYLREALGAERFERYRAHSPIDQTIGGGAGTAEWRRATRSPQSAWWASPAANTRDLATAAIPELLYDRMDELGLDYAVLFPTKALGSARVADPEIRRGVC